MEAGSISTRNAPNINDVADSLHTFVTPQAVFTGDLHVMGDLRVNGQIIADGDIIAGGPGGISLLNHTHTDTAGTSAGITSPPN